MKRIMLAVCLALPAAPLAIRAPRDSSLPTLFHIGDSTVRNGSGNGANGQRTIHGVGEETQEIDNLLTHQHA